MKAAAAEFGSSLLVEALHIRRQRHAKLLAAARALGDQDPDVAALWAKTHTCDCARTLVTARAYA